MTQAQTQAQAQPEPLFRVLDEPLAKLPDRTWQSATAASFLSWSYRCTPTKRPSRAVEVVSALEAIQKTLEHSSPDAADFTSRRSYSHSRTCGSAIGEAEVQVCKNDDEGCLVMKKVPSRPGSHSGKCRPSTAPRSRSIVPGSPSSQRARARAKAKSRPTSSSNNNSNNNRSDQPPPPPPAGAPSRPRRVVVQTQADAGPGEGEGEGEKAETAAAAAAASQCKAVKDRGLVPKPPPARLAGKSRPCKAERKRQLAQALATRQTAAAVTETAKRLERVTRLVQECEQRIQSKTVPRMRRILRPWPEGYWVTRDGVIVKLTSNEMIWPNGKRERTEIDMDAGTLLVCSHTTSFLDPKAKIRRAHFVASEIVWEMGDRWVEFIGDIDEDPRQLVLADPSVGSYESAEDPESEQEEGEEECELDATSKTSSCRSFGEDSDDSRAESKSGGSGSSSGPGGKESEDEDSDSDSMGSSSDDSSESKEGGPRMGHAATVPTKVVQKPHSRSSVFTAADSRPISKRSSEGAVRSPARDEVGKRASTGHLKMVGKRQSTQRGVSAAAVSKRSSQSKETPFGPSHSGSTGGGGGGGGGGGKADGSNNNSHNGTLGSSDDVVRLLSQELHESPSPPRPTTPPRLLGVGTRHHSVQPLGSSSSLGLSMSSLPSLQDRDGSGNNTPANRSMRSFSVASPPRTPIQMSVMPTLSGSNRASTSAFVVPQTKRRATAKRKPTFEGKEFEKQEAQVLAGTLAEDLKTRFRGAVQEGPERRSSDLWKIAHMARDLSLTHDDIRDASLIFEAGLGRAKQVGKLTYLQFESVAAQLLEANSMGNHLDLDALKVCCRDHWSAAKHKMHIPQMDFQECLGWYSRNRFNTDLTCTKEQRLHIDMARKYRCPEKTIHDIKSCYDQFDKDGSGNISLEEFAGVLKLLMKLPGDGDLPRHRIEVLWREIDFDGSGFACFEEFTRWWMSRRSTLIPYDCYYRTIRDLSREPDPIVRYDDTE